MPKHIRSKSQAKFERRALKKLRALGLYTGKIDLRRRLSRYQVKQIAKFSDVVTGKAAVVRPAAPSSYKKLYNVKNKIVIVPRHKGEKISVNKSGEIVSKRMTRGGRLSSRWRKLKAIEKEKPRTFYFVPFIRGRQKDGTPILEWKRYPNMAALNAFIHEYEKHKYKNVREFIIEESFDIPPASRNRILDPILKKRGLKPRFNRRRVNRTGRNE